MDAKLINPFINATLNVLETMASTKSEAGKRINFLLFPTQFTL